MVKIERVSWFVLLSAAAALASALAAPSAPGQEPPKAKPAELREYKGEKLEPIRRFRENSIKGPQPVDLKAYRLEVGGLVDRPLSLSYDEVLARPAESRVIVIHCVEGWDVKVLWEGVPLASLIDAAGPATSANTVIFRSVDGYTTSLPLAYIRQKNVLLAFKMNGLTLPEERGFPFEVAAEGKWGYKWARWVASIELSDDPNFRGFWERMGYNNNGDFSGPKFEKR
jgi:DMSO/TMAO reductase YedYZ molybdopterin-dependent catalytic subunit